VCEPGYAAFAVMQVKTMLLGDDLEGLLRETKKLVGEVDFGAGFGVDAIGEIKMD